MVVVDGIDALEPDHGPVFVVVGVFDGLHRGHQYLLEHLVAGAGARKARPTVVTFDSHPDEILTGKAPPLLLDPAERLERLASAGVEVTVVQHFDVALRMTPYDEFISRIAARTRISGFLMTPDAAFGHDRGGTAETVTALGRTTGFDVAVVPPFELDGRPVRSSDIRSAIAAGDLAGADRLLGRPYGVMGEGTEIGVSRVAMSFAMPVALPPPGEYGVTIEWSDGTPPWAAGAIIGKDGRLTLATIPFVGPARVVFADAGSLA
ncbi:MAG: FAD synthetase family protein [Chloroflexi bacterium]|nr:FAD synthetase family protein [Chloroflexota bacterium]